MDEQTSIVEYSLSLPGNEEFQENSEDNQNLLLD
jgi:hypothetical protein